MIEIVVIVCSFFSFRVIMPLRHTKEVQMKAAVH